MSKTKKVSSAGRYGVRYGLKIRKQLVEIEKVQKAKHKCPFCSKVGKIKRTSKGIWECGKCNTKFAAKTYSPSITED